MKIIKNLPWKMLTRCEYPHSIRRFSISELNYFNFFLFLFWIKLFLLFLLEVFFFPFIVFFFFHNCIFINSYNQCIYSYLQFTSTNHKLSILQPKKNYKYFKMQNTCYAFKFYFEYDKQYLKMRMYECIVHMIFRYVLHLGALILFKLRKYWNFVLE
jgi:hypothetical protein